MSCPILEKENVIEICILYCLVLKSRILFLKLFVSTWVILAFLFGVFLVLFFFLGGGGRFQGG